MKKIVLALVCAVMSLGAFAQVSYGVKAGFDMTNFVGSDVDHKMMPNYQVGLFVEKKFNDKFGIAPEAAFAAQGGKPNDVDFQVNYINVPVMLKYYATEDLAIDFGPQVGFNVYSKLEGVDMKDATKTVDFGLGLGGTYNLAENFFLQARYTMGLTDAFKSEGLIKNNAKNGNIQLSVGYRF